MFNHFDTCFSHTFQILWILKDNRVICTSIASGSPELWRFAHVRNGKQKTETAFVCLLSLGTSRCNWQSLKDRCLFFFLFVQFFRLFFFFSFGVLPVECTCLQSKELPKLTKLSSASLYHIVREIRCTFACPTGIVSIVSVIFSRSAFAPCLVRSCIAHV